jgi:hypothetical protein
LCCVSFIEDDQKQRKADPHQFSDGSAFFFAASPFFVDAAFLFLAAALPSFVAVVRGSGLAIGMLELMKADSGSGR